MPPYILVAFSSLFSEISDTIGKIKIAERPNNLYALGFLNSLWGGVIFILIGIFRHQDFIFDPDSISAFLPRVILEIILAHLVLFAISKSDRSLFSVVRTGTIPLLLITDIFVGYNLTGQQIAGVIIIFVGLLTLALNPKIQKRGFWIVLATTFIAASTLSLFKYDITHYNSVAAEQSIVYLCLMLYFFISAVARGESNPLSLLGQKVYLFQSVSIGMAEVLSSFAYLFAPASVITTASRAFSVFAAFLSGKIYFREKETKWRLVSVLITVLGVVFLVKS